MVMNIPLGLSPFSGERLAQASLLSHLKLGHEDGKIYLGQPMKRRRAKKKQESSQWEGFYVIQSIAACRCRQTSLFLYKRHEIRCKYSSEQPELTYCADLRTSPGISLFKHSCGASLQFKGRLFKFDTSITPWARSPRSPNLACGLDAT